VSIPVVINGSTYYVPETPEEKWGPDTTNVIVALANNSVNFDMATAVFVASNGSDLNTGNHISVPKKTIQAACNAAYISGSHKSIVVLDGATYNESLNFSGNTYDAYSYDIFAPAATIAGTIHNLGEKTSGTNTVNIICSNFIGSFNNNGELHLKCHNWYPSLVANGGDVTPKTHFIEAETIIGPLTTAAGSTFYIWAGTISGTESYGGTIYKEVLDQGNKTFSDITIDTLTFASTPGNTVSEIVTVVDDLSDDTQIPTAKAVEDRADITEADANSYSDGVASQALTDANDYTDTAVSGLTPNTRTISTIDSLTGGGDLTADRTLSLVNDSATPGNNKVYGTDGAGTKGWKNDPAGGIPEAPSDGSTYGRKNASWVAVSSGGTGDVVGPASAVDDRIATFDGVTGKLIQDGGVTIAEVIDDAQSPDYIDFVTNPTVPGPHQEGRASWNPSDHTLELQTDVDGVKLQVGQENFIRVRNITGSSLLNGSVVYVTGANTARATVALADADLATADKTIGLVTADIADGDFGYVTVFGLVRDLDTSIIANEGDTVYLSQTPGEFTSTPPAKPAHIVKIGTCINKSALTGSILVNVEVGADLGELHDVELTTVADRDLLEYDATSTLWKNRINPDVVSKNMTGFDLPDDVVVTYNSVNRTITLTGTWAAYWQGKPLLELDPTFTDGWVSDAHPASPTSTQFLYFDGSSFVWATSPWTFDQLMIAAVVFDSIAPYTYVYTLRETHGLQNWYDHREDHLAIGTILVSGGDLSSIVTGSTTAANRRPIISETVLQDEDLRTTNVENPYFAYSLMWLTGAGIPKLNFLDGYNDIGYLSGNRPYYNRNNGGTWDYSTLFPSNNYGKFFVLASPTANDDTDQSQDRRFLLIPPQQVSGSLSTIQAVTTSTLNLGNLASISPEFIFVAEIIVRYTGGNWVITSYAKLGGTKVVQTVSNPVTPSVRNDLLVIKKGGSVGIDCDFTSIADAVVAYPSNAKFYIKQPVDGSAYDESLSTTGLSNLTFIGEGMNGATTWSRAAGTVITGTGTNITFRDIYFTAASNNIVEIAGATNMKFSSCSFVLTSTGARGINCSSGTTTGMVVENCYFTGFTYSAISMYGTSFTNYVIKGCLIEATANSFGIDMYNGNTNGIIESNILNVKNNGIYTNGSNSKLIIQNNIVRGSNGCLYGIVVASSGTYINVSGNIIDTINTGAGNGLYMVSVSQCSAIGNTITGCTVGLVIGSTTNCVVTGNVYFNNATNVSDSGGHTNLTLDNNSSENYIARHLISGLGV
jgi:parallel beta-helix repeat protein